jgi:hypothetical protein
MDDALVSSLVEAFTTERRLLDELRAVLQRQRDAVDADDLQAVDDSVFATHRVLVTLDEARQRRRHLNALIGEREDLGVHALDVVLGMRMTPALRTARDELRHAARALADEVAVNRRVLRVALSLNRRPARRVSGEIAAPGRAPRAARFTPAR